ncbi:DUF4113 domain-containing protein [Flavobacterium sp. TAB 87]|uniref:DUF4113 domain-containing protein n=1 Tax=Flavobacterium sp. TAB 87 TaxID=1729581 RepID=UPI00076D9A03|nr:DUF4113 domain-containing protein [Flavobacterium sp. TAB 87]KVV16352.1 DNA polymerase V subunit UmuC [Flavobacterium sp. TAB 87]
MKIRVLLAYYHLPNVLLFTAHFKLELGGQYNWNLHYGTKTIKIPFPTSSTFEIIKYAYLALDSIFKEGYNYKKAGVIITGISGDTTQQLSMFEYENPKHKILMPVLDKINLKLGDKIKFGGQDLKQKWKMRQEHLSLCYSSKLKDIITVKC